ncbi:Cysteine desulfurase [Pseudoalteromonas luteoviolacea B = ATCC 29581]|nr:Cysteine desulfurase [Pseudoalteromonas luteoviolacea B = ATCC 29581]
MFDVNAIRAQFPILSRTVHNNSLVYLDNGATTHKPLNVIEKEREFYLQNNANVHRGTHFLSANATAQYEAVREILADFLQVQSRELVWTKGATESLNLIAHGLTPLLQPNDIILISELEHHANIVPWQQLALRTGAVIKAIKVNRKGCIHYERAVAQIQNLKPKIVSICHASNGLGNILPIESLIREAKAIGAITVIDGAQSFAQIRPNLRELDCDFYVASAHKAFGPTGVGLLFGKYELLNEMPPYQCGGEMIDKVTISHSSFNQAPSKFEAGTPNIAGVIAFGEAIKFISSIPFEEWTAHKKDVFNTLISEMQTIEQVELYGDLNDNIGTVSFTVKNQHPIDVATLLDHHGIAVRTGHHCNQPLMDALAISGTIRASIAIYNTVEEIDHFIFALRDVISLLEE